MASRKEQKEAARQARLAAEAEAKAKAARARRMQLGMGGIAGVAAVAAAAIAIAAGGGKTGTGNPSSAPGAPAGVKLPAQKIADLATAAKAAGCVLIDTPDSVALASANRQHVAVGTKVNYATNPPSYGPHYPVPASDGIYTPSNTPAISYLVHALEHGRIEYQYKPGTPQSVVNQVLAMFYEGDGNFAPKQYLLVFQNPTNMPYEVAATSWGHLIGCNTWNSGVVDAFRDFRLKYSFKGPETAYPGPE